MCISFRIAAIKMANKYHFKFKKKKKKRNLHKTLHLNEIISCGGIWGKRQPKKTPHKTIIILSWLKWSNILKCLLWGHSEIIKSTRFLLNTSILLRIVSHQIINLYPFHIAKCAVTPHWTPLSIHPLCCCYTPVCFHTECRISAFWRVRFKKRSKIEQKDIITPMHCLAFPSALFGAPFHIDNRTVANCGFWLEYASKTPLEVGADLPRRMRLFWLRCQIMRLRSVHIKPHYSQNAFDSALLAWYERGKSFIFDKSGSKTSTRGMQYSESKNM